MTVAYMYVPVPVQPRERLQFLAKLKKKDHLEGVDVIGMDADCVANSELTLGEQTRQKPRTLPYTHQSLRIC